MFIPHSMFPGDENLKLDLCIREKGIEAACSGEFSYKQINGDVSFKTHFLSIWWVFDSHYDITTGSLQLCSRQPRIAWFMSIKTERKIKCLARYSLVLNINKYVNQ